MPSKQLIFVAILRSLLCMTKFSWFSRYATLQAHLCTLWGHAAGTLFPLAHFRYIEIVTSEIMNLGFSVRNGVYRSLGVFSSQEMWFVFPQCFNSLIRALHLEGGFLFPRHCSRSSSPIHLRYIETLTSVRHDQLNFPKCLSFVFLLSQLQADTQSALQRHRRSRFPHEAFIV